VVAVFSGRYLLDHPYVSMAPAVFGTAPCHLLAGFDPAPAHLLWVPCGHGEEPLQACASLRCTPAYLPPVQYLQEW
jgi:hypothetical protein